MSVKSIASLPLSRAAYRLAGAALRIGGLARAAQTPIFVAGSQRSGTTMLLRILALSPDVRIYGEAAKQAFSKDSRLLPEDNIRFLVYKCQQPFVVFKPLNDSQHFDRILDAHTNAKGLWIYRHFADVANSMTVKWGDAQVTHISHIIAGHFPSPGDAALGEGITSENLEMLKSFSDVPLSPFESGVLIWYLRNSIYFDLELGDRADVLLCKYEDVVEDPYSQLGRIFDFIGCPFKSEYAESVHSSSINKKEAPALRPELERMCGALQKRLDAAFGHVPDREPHVN